MTSESCRVLVVDDHRDAADTAVALLKLWGHASLAVYSAHECIAAAKAFDPDVVLMDLGLPGKDGFKVNEDLQKVLPGVRVIALTGFTQEHIVRRTRESGFADYLMKPADATDLKKAVDGQCTIARGL